MCVSSVPSTDRLPRMHTALMYLCYCMPLRYPLWRLFCTIVFNLTDNRPAREEGIAIPVIRSARLGFAIEFGVMLDSEIDEK